MKRQHDLHRSGDINLVACLRTLGFPPGEEPASVVMDESGRSYVTFYSQNLSSDGQLDTGSVARAWNSNTGRLLGIEGMSWLMPFIKDAREAGARYAEDFFEHAHIYLIEQGESAKGFPKSIAEVEQFIDYHKDTEAGHIFAFCANRHFLANHIKQARRRVRIQRGEQVAMIDTGLDKHKTREILARTEG